LELAQAHSRIAWLSITSDPDAAEAHIDTALEKYTSLGDSSGIANSHYRYGVLYRVQGDYNRAVGEIDLYLGYVQGIRDTFKIVNGTYQKAVIYMSQGRYEKSIQEYFDVLRTYEALGDSTSIGFTLNSIGIVLKNMRKYQDAKAYLERAKSINEKLGDEENLANTLNSMGNLEAEQENFEEALKYYEAALQIDRKLDIIWGEAINNKNIGTVLLTLGENREALDFLLKAESIQEDNGYNKDLAETKAKLAQAYLKLGKIEDAERTVKEGLDLGIASLEVEKELYNTKSQILEAKGNYKEAIENHRIFTQIQDSIFNIENTRNINALAARYESDLKDREIQTQASIIEDQAYVLDKTNAQKYLAIGGGVLALIFAFGIWFTYSQRQRLKNQEIENLQKQKEIASLEAFIQGEENERKRVAQDLHDGVNGDLSVLKYKVSSIDSQKQNSDVDNLKAEAVELIDRACEQVRAISHNLAPSILKSFSLEDAVREFVSELSASSGIKISFQYFGKSAKLPVKKETVIYRMIQEMVNNIVKHSGATEALVQINLREEELVLEVEDNGRGFDINQSHKGLGLNTIYSRVDYLNAEIEAESSNLGTSYTIQIPIENRVET
jgi:signal transduction histidine kinase